MVVDMFMTNCNIATFTNFRVVVMRETNNVIITLIDKSRHHIKKPSGIATVSLLQVHLNFFLYFMQISENEMIELSIPSVYSNLTSPKSPSPSSKCAEYFCILC